MAATGGTKEEWEEWEEWEEVEAVVREVKGIRVDATGGDRESVRSDRADLDGYGDESGRLGRARGGTWLLDGLPLGTRRNE